MEEGDSGQIKQKGLGGVGYMASPCAWKVLLRKAGASLSGGPAGEMAGEAPRSPGNEQGLTTPSPGQLAQGVPVEQPFSLFLRAERSSLWQQVPSSRT